MGASGGAYDITFEVDGTDTLKQNGTVIESKTVTAASREDFITQHPA